MNENEKKDAPASANTNTEVAGQEQRPEIVTQINALYQAREDRILLRATSNLDREFKLWITFRIFRLLDGAFEEIDNNATPQHIPEASRAAVKEFRREQTLQKAHFTKGYEDKHLESVFGEHPLLVDGINIKVKKEGNTVILVFIGEGKQCAIPLTREALIPTRHLLERAAVQAGWMKKVTDSSQVTEESKGDNKNEANKILH